MVCMPSSGLYPCGPYGPGCICSFGIIPCGGPYSPPSKAPSWVLCATKQTRLAFAQQRPLRNRLMNSGEFGSELTFRMALRRSRPRNLAVERRPPRPLVLLVAGRRPRTPADIVRIPGTPAQTRQPGEKTIWVRPETVGRTLEEDCRRFPS